MVFMNTHKQIHTLEKNKQAICAVSSLRSVMYDFEMHFYAFWWPPPTPNPPLPKNHPTRVALTSNLQCSQCKHIEPLLLSTGAQRDLCLGRLRSLCIHGFVALNSRASQTQKKPVPVRRTSRYTSKWWLVAQQNISCQLNPGLHKTNCMQSAVKVPPKK